ncbi:MAG: 4Fe-4S dicluster domain-containing protein [Desulfobacula sp.]|nr:4Fe-4S dicluster domain-containing protein [Desulfobacula sp.]
MVSKGAILLRDTGEEPSYCLLPFLVGMYEMQLGHCTPSFFIDSQKYINEKFAVEYLTTMEKQFRVVPIGKSITPKQNIASYDEVREIIDRSNGKIALRKCVCKYGNDLIDKPCKVTDRREICMEFRDYYNVTIRAKMGVPISKKEARDITDQNEKDGLIILTSTMQNPQFLCGCCNCCCGALGMVGALPRPVDFIRSNFFTTIKVDSCIGCQTCSKRCQMNALISDAETKKIIAIDEKRCIGCGLCVATCKSGSLKLKNKEDQFVPPKNFDDLFELIIKNKKVTSKKEK